MNTIRTFFKRDYFVLTSLVSKDFKVKYRRSVLGVAWSVLNPLMMMFVITAVFSFIFRFDIEFFPLYLILGTSVFNFMTGATSGGLVSIIDSADLIKKIRINKAIFPMEKVLFELVNFTISLVAVAAVFLYFHFQFGLQPTLNILFLPLLLFYLSIFSLGLALLLSALAVFFRDVYHLWGVFTMAWMYATPLFYPVEMLDPVMQQVMKFNPMYHYVTYMRHIVLWGDTPSLLLNIACLAMALITLLIGVLVFRKLQKRFILYV